MVHLDIIKEIAELIDTDEVVYMHIETHEILSYPSPKGAGYTDEFDYLIQEVMDIVDMAPEMYLRFDPPDSNEGYQIMAGFVETISNDQTKALAMSVLSGKRPFRQFRGLVEDKGLEDDWYDFKDAYLQMLVRDKIAQE